MSSIAPLLKGKRAEEWLNGVNIDALERHPMISPLEKGLVEGDHGKRLWEKWAVKYARPSEGMVVLDRGFGGPRGGDNIPTIGVIYNFKHDEYGIYNEYQNDNPWLKKCSILYEVEVSKCSDGFRWISWYNLQTTMRENLSNYSMKLDSKLVYFEEEKEFVRLQFENGDIYHTKLLIGADGYNSIMGKCHGDI